MRIWLGSIEMRIIDTAQRYFTAVVEDRLKNFHRLNNSREKNDYQTCEIYAVMQSSKISSDSIIFRLYTRSF